MVEAGANEIPEAEILDALDIAHDAIKKLCAAQRELAEKAGKEKLRSRSAGRSRALRADQGLAWRGARRRHSGRGQARAPGRDQGGRGADHRPVLGRPRGRDLRRVPRQRAAGLRQAREDADPRADRGPEEAPRRPRRRRDQADLDRGQRRSPHARLGAVHARPDAGASASSRSAPRARRCGSTRSGWRPPSATSTTTTSRPSRSGRRASCAGPSAATSATARSPSGRWCR